MYLEQNGAKSDYYIDRDCNVKYYGDALRGFHETNNATQIRAFLADISDNIASRRTLSPISLMTAPNSVVRRHTFSTRIQGMLEEFGCSKPSLARLC